MSIVEIVAERPDSEVAISLIRELDGVLNPLYPSESRHGFSVDKLLQEGVLFFVVWVDGRAAGCGGVKLLADEGYAEVKRMYVRPEFQGQKLAYCLLAHLETVVQEQGIALLRLETGIYQDAAIRLYERFGFVPIRPFGDYFEDPVSRCYEKRIESGGSG